jgi:HEAT repeat protein
MHSWEGDPRQQPTPDYGSASPGSDLPPDRSLDPRAGSWRILFAVCAGILLALVLASGMARGAFADIARLLTLRGDPQPVSPAQLSQHEIESLHRQTAQQQAELLLERDINHYDGANDEIAARAEGWRGRIQLRPQLNSLITTALNSSDLRVRAAGIEVDLAAMNMAKTPESAARLREQAENSQRSERIWALWGLGLLGNRGVETEQASQTLVAQLHDSDSEVRHWAVEGLAYLGTDDTIAPLLQTLHEDASPTVRERAACSLAQSGMLTQEQRRSALPALLAFADDSALDAQTHTWVFQALRDITRQSLPNDIAAWRSWYSASGEK